MQFGAKEDKKYVNTPQDWRLVNRKMNEVDRGKLCRGEGGLLRLPLFVEKKQVWKMQFRDGCGENIVQEK